jgi:catechol 2,3-dioxygenase-like lactoylglutathione lyase family enzyme
MSFHHVALRVGADRVTDLHAFYDRTLGLPARSGGLGLPTRSGNDAFTVPIGESELEFRAGPGEPFYHFALLVPGNRFDAALAWARERVELLPHRDSPAVVFDFPAWNAHAAYFHDPAGNIVELIAHRDREVSGHRDRDARGHRGGFDPSELLGLSELGLVGVPTAMAPPLTQRLGLEVWDGRVADRDALAFVGVPARTLILVPVGRGWLPTGRPAERHPIEVVLSGEERCEVELEDGLYRVSRRP